MNPKFNDIKTGMNASDIISILGCPDIVENFGTKYSGLIYQHSEFLFENGKLILKKSNYFQTKFRNTVSQPANFIIECA